MISHQTTKDFTQGNIYFQLISLTTPLIFGNILQQFYNTIDAFVVGRFAGQEEFAAIGIAGSVMNLFLFILVGACTGLSILFARFYGTKDYAMLHKQHFTALILGLSFTILLGAAGLFGMKYLLLLIKTPTNLFSYTSTYLSWIFLSLPAIFLYNMYAAALRASGDTKASLYILALAISCNLILDVIFVAYLKLGIGGAAMATALTQCISALLCILYLMHFHREFLFNRQDCSLNQSLLHHTASYCLATSIHQAGLYIGKIILQGIINTAGTDIISAYTAATRIEGFANSFGDSTSASTSVLVSQNYGSKNTGRTHKIFRCSVKITALLGLLCSVVLFVTAKSTIKLMIGNSNPVAFTSAVSYLKIVALFYVFCFTGGSFTGFYNGIGKIIITLIGSIGQITLRIIISYFLFAHMELNAVAVATGIGWIATNLFWLLYFLPNFQFVDAVCN